ncbi:unnamed protein product [Linum tenue]|uniref:Uncharacterized protein n=1 Tax=Linum tenue TaxID=586396 RepID=A0AAV0MI10_9ROSI|nr:unnamed protein product [Linum tenue]
MAAAEPSSMESFQSPSLAKKVTMFIVSLVTLWISSNATLLLLNKFLPSSNNNDELSSGLSMFPTMRITAPACQIAAYFSVGASTLHTVKSTMVSFLVIVVLLGADPGLNGRYPAVDCICLLFSSLAFLFFVVDLLHHVAPHQRRFTRWASKKSGIRSFSLRGVIAN